MANTNKAIFGVVKDHAQAERVIDQLRAAGIPLQDISILYSDSKGQFTQATEANRNWRTEDRLTDHPVTGADARTTDYKAGTGKGGLTTETNSKAPEGATTGATTGGIIGGVLGLLAGIGALAIPGAGPFIAAGPIMGALSGIGLGAPIGGIVGGLIGLGIPEYEAKHYENKLLKEGGVLLSVVTHNTNDTSRIEDIMKKAGAEHISSATPTSAK